MSKLTIILGILLLAYFLVYNLLSNRNRDYFTVLTQVNKTEKVNRTHYFTQKINKSGSEKVNLTHVFSHNPLKAKTHYDVMDIPSHFIKRQPDHVVKAYKLFFSRANNERRITVKENCPVRGFMTISPGGRLGNLMSQYATLYANALIDGVIPVINSKMKIVLKKYFISISLVTFEEFGFGCKLNVTQVNQKDYKRNITSRLEVETCWYINCCPNDARMYHQFRDEILEQFQFKQKYVNKANDRLKSVLKSQKNVTLIGLHIRRDDYPDYLRRHNKTEVGVEYLQQAMRHCRNQFGNVAFLVVSDTMEWARINLQNETSIYYVGEGKISEPATDMATMSLCNHTIITQGTYSFWTGYLNKGQTIARNGSNSDIGYTLVPHL